MSETVTITVRLTVDALHHWPDAPPAREYLKRPHFHRFEVAASLTVSHADREVEFHDLLDVVNHELYHLGNAAGAMLDFGARSCESIARHVAAELRRTYGHERTYVVSVFEEQTAGSTVTINP